MLWQIYLIVLCSSLSPELSHYPIYLIMMLSFLHYSLLSSVYTLQSYGYGQLFNFIGGN